MGRMVKKGFLQELGLELYVGGCRSWIEGVASVNEWNWERTWYVQELPSSGTERDDGEPP